mmetsp:Transcript_46031/g.115458  ORF Transcript_46031/g.115458 Transcript_46031/m.115458 type:complete len:202 (+) Transcript_46031:585-1190(+)
MTHSTSLAHLFGVVYPGSSLSVPPSPRMSGAYVRILCDAIRSMVLAPSSDAPSRPSTCRSHTGRADHVRPWSSTTGVPSSGPFAHTFMGWPSSALTSKLSGSAPSAPFPTMLISLVEDATMQLATPRSAHTGRLRIAGRDGRRAHGAEEGDRECFGLARRRFAGRWGRVKEETGVKRERRRRAAARICRRDFIASLDAIAS